MNRPIIFISGWGVPKFLEKTSLAWNDEMWKDYSRIYLSSKTPVSDVQVSNHLNELNKFVNSFPDPIVMGQSLVAWWAGNLACQKGTKISKLILFLPLAHLADYKFFNVSSKYSLFNREPIVSGPHKVLVAGATKDIIAPYGEHAARLANKYNACSYSLNGGHYFQQGHKACLNFMKDWIEI